MSPQSPNEHEEPIVSDKRRIDPVTGKVRGSASAGAASSAPAGPAAGADSAAADVDTSSTAEANVDEMDAAGAPSATDAPAGARASASTAADAAPADAIDDELEQLLAGAQAEQSADAKRAEEHLRDLQRISAEYANYRRRTEQEKLAARDANTAEVLRSLLPVLDDLDRAQQHGDLPEDGAMTVIANKLRGTLAKLGLEVYGEVGDAFDPTVHEAIAQLPNPEVSGETVADVVERGYRVGERIVRVAKVAVFTPAS